MKPYPIRRRPLPSEEGFILIAVIFMLALFVIAMSIAVPNISRQIERDREVETMHRGQQFVRALKLYHKKFGNYPPSEDALLNTNQIRFLRKKYIDPSTGKDEWKPIHMGENKQPTAFGFFGKPMASSMMGGMGGCGGGGISGLNSSGLGSSDSGSSSFGSSSFGSSSSGSSSLSSSSIGSSGLDTSTNMGSNTPMGGCPTSDSDASSGGTNANGSSNPSGTNGSSGNSTDASGNNNGTNGNASGTDSGSSTGSSFSGSSTGSSSTSAFGTPSGTGIGGQTFGGGGIIGFSPGSSKKTILLYKKQNHYNKWEFVYDPAQDQMIQIGGGATGIQPSGNMPNGNNPFGGSTNGFDNSGGGFGNSGGGGFGNSGGGGFGNSGGGFGSSGSSFGSSGSSDSGSSTSSPPQ